MISQNPFRLLGVLSTDSLKEIKKNFLSESLDENETKSVINEIYKNEKILIDPHTAVAIGVIKKITLVVFERIALIQLISLLLFV